MNYSTPNNNVINSDYFAKLINAPKQQNINKILSSSPSPSPCELNFTDNTNNNNPKKNLNYKYDNKSTPKIKKIKLNN